MPETVLGDEITNSKPYHKSKLANLAGWATWANPSAIEPDSSVVVYLFTPIESTDPPAFVNQTTLGSRAAELLVEAA